MMPEFDPLLVKGVYGAVILGLAAFLAWHGKIPDSIMATLLLGAAAAVGFQLS